MKPQLHNRKSIRLKGFDYSQEGLYFITLCTQYRKNLFGKIEHGEMILNEAGKMIREEWQALAQRFANIELHEYIVMPNHFHSILEITNGDADVRASLVLAPVRGISPPPTSFSNRPVGDSKKREDLEGHLNEQAQGLPENPVGAPLVGDQNGNVGDQNGNVGNPRLGDIVGAYKSITTVKYIENVKKNNWKRFSKKLWQRNYWEHIIRNHKEYQHISQYIINNPQKWQQDKFYK